LINPQTTPHSIPTNPATAPREHYRGSQVSIAAAARSDPRPFERAAALDLKGFSEANLRRAWADAKNEDIAASNWTLPDPARYGNMINFYKNVCIMGGFFLLYITGAGK